MTYTVDLTDEDWQNSSRWAMRLMEENYGGKTRAWSDNRDVVGNLALLAVRRFLGEHCGDHVVYDPCVPRQFGDNGDGKIRDLIFDVKGHEAKLKRKLVPDRYTKCWMYEHQKSKIVGMYIFVTVHLESKSAAILGGISYKDFWDQAVEVSGVYPHHEVSYLKLKDLMDIVMAV
jgi:hypothetical protein